jgi:Aminoglycoside-2''-adenylyltransferase
MPQREPTIYDVHSVIDRLAHARLAAWLFGGWAEELWGVYAPRAHRDIDLLYPATDFVQLDHWLANVGGVAEIAAKRFHHKRAFIWDGVMIEALLLEPIEGARYRTSFFDQRCELLWPEDTLSQVLAHDRRVPVASRAALRLYRQRHDMIAAAYQAYTQASR